MKTCDVMTFIFGKFLISFGKDLLDNNNIVLFIKTSEVKAKRKIQPNETRGYKVLFKTTHDLQKLLGKSFSRLLVERVTSNKTVKLS